MEAILDTNFIISCVMKRIDFLEQLEGKGFKISVPREVINELKNLKKSSRQSHEERIAINAALTMLDSSKIKRISLGAGKVDDGLVVKGQNGAYIATLDNEIKRKVPNRIVIFSAKNEIGIERD